MSSKLTKEERLERARAKVARLKEVGQRDARSDRMDWKPKAKIYLHPETEINDRLRVWFPREVAEKDEKGNETGKKKVASVPFTVPADPKACPFQTLRDVLRGRDDIDEDETILSVGSGRGKVELCKGEILGLKGYDFRKSLKPQADFVCAAIKVGDKKGKRPDKLKVEVLAGAKSLATELRKEIESEMDESGEEAGNPFFTPYPFLIEYDENEQGSDMYSARGRSQEHPEEDDEELLGLLDSEAPDLEEETKLSDPDAMLAALRAALVRDDIEVEIENADEVFKKPKAEKKPAEKKAAEKKPAAEEPPRRRREPDPEPEAEEPEAEEPEESEAEESTETEEPPPRAERRPARRESEAEEKPPEKPAARKEKVAAPKKEAAKPKKELGWVPKEGEEYDICPKCREPVPTDATKCPHPGCGAEYVADDEDF